MAAELHAGEQRDAVLHSPAPDHAAEVRDVQLLPESEPLPGDESSVVAQAQAFGDPLTEVLHQDVRPLDQLSHDLDASGMLEVQRDPELLPVQCLEEGRHAVGHP